MKRYVRIVVKRDGKLLLLYQKGLGRYLFVGGKVGDENPNESWEDAAIREFREEVASQITDMVLISERVVTLDDDANRGMWLGRYYFAERIIGEPVNQEVDKHSDLSYWPCLPCEGMHRVTIDVIELVKNLPDTIIVPRES